MNPSHYCVVFLVLLAVAYLIGLTGSKPPPECCDGAKAQVAATPTPEDRKAACVCFKVVAQSIPINPQHAHDLPHNCNIRLPFEITPDLDCNKIGYCRVQ